MTNRPYENREIDEKFKYIAEKLELIHQQTTKTNGRMTEAEKDIEGLNLWKSNLMGRIATVTIIGGALWAMAVAWITKKFF